MSPPASRPENNDPEALIESLDPQDLRMIVSRAAEHHEDVARAVRLAAARQSGDLSQLRAEVDRLRTSHRYLGYRESRDWAMKAMPVVEAIAEMVDSSPTAELVALIELTIARVVKVILKADDSNGLIGYVARELLDLHARACDAGKADPVKLARWMVRFRFDDQDFFEVDPVRYANALGELGLAAYRREIKQRVEAGGGDSFAISYAQERLAILDGDIEALVEMLGGDLSQPYQFISLAEAMAELGRDDDVLFWAIRGITQSSGWQVAQLYDLAVEVHLRRGEDQEVLQLRREQHQQMTSSTTYHLLSDAAQVCGMWSTERAAARAVLAKRDLGGLVDVLLFDGEAETAWQVLQDHPEWDPDPQRWMHLAEAREASMPSDALEVYLRLVDIQLETTGKAAYVRAVAILKKAAEAARAANSQDEFATHLAALRETHRRRPTFMAVLEKARLE